MTSSASVPQPAIPFTYAVMDTAARVAVQHCAAEIRGRMRRATRDILDIGQRLIEAKSYLSHGQFGPWLAAEFQWSERTAQRFMQVAEQFKSANLADMEIAPAALYLLASAPESARDEALSSDQPVTRKAAQAIIARHAPAPAIDDSPPPWEPYAQQAADTQASPPPPPAAPAASRAPAMEGRRRPATAEHPTFAVTLAVPRHVHLAMAQAALGRDVGCVEELYIEAVTQYLATLVAPAGSDPAALLRIERWVAEMGGTDDLDPAQPEDARQCLYDAYALIPAVAGSHLARLDACIATLRAFLAATPETLQ